MKISTPERETVILLNEADELEGYFQFFSLRKKHFDKLVKKVGRINLIECIELKDKSGRAYQWDCKVPIKYLSKYLCFTSGTKRGGGFKKKEAPVEA
jgi:hypothetical protein